MERLKLRSVLITDRTQQDVKRAESLLTLFGENGVWGGSQIERDELDASKGIYTPVDVNRVLRACSWLVGRLESYGYSVPGEYFPAVLIHISVIPEYGGVAGSFLAYQGETAIARAFNRDGFTFIRWEENGVTVSTNAEYIFTATEDRELVAVFDVPKTDASGIVGLAVVGVAIVGKDLT